MRLHRILQPVVFIGLGLFAGAMMSPLRAAPDEPAASQADPQPDQDAKPATPEPEYTIVPSAAPVKVPSCDSPEMAERLMSSFNASGGAQSLNVSAVAIHDAAEIDAASVLATRLDRGTPPGENAEVAVHCKAHIELSTGHTMSQVFRVDVHPATGQEKVVGTPIYDADFDVPALAAAPPPPENPPGTNATSTLPPRKPLPMGSALAAKQPSAGPTAPIVKQRELPPGTVLCTSEADIGRFLFAQKLGLTCFRLVKPAGYVVTIRKATGYQQVRLSGGDHRGATGWTAIMVSMPQR